MPMNVRGEHFFGAENAGGSEIFLLGDTRRPEFALIRTDLKRMAAERFASLVEVRSLFDPGDPLSYFRAHRSAVPDLFFFFESFSGEFSTSIFDGVRQLFPLAPMVLIAGALCEGQGRRGTIPAGVIRFYHHQWRSFGRGETLHFLRGRTGRFALPPMALDEDAVRTDSYREVPFEQNRTETLGENLLPFVRPQEPSGAKFLPDLCVVAPDDSAMAGFLIDLALERSVRAGRFSIAELLAAAENRGFRPRSILFDSVAPRPIDDLEILKQIAEAFPYSAICVLAFGPQYEEIARLEEIPNLTVQSKPCEISALF